MESEKLLDKADNISDGIPRQEKQAWLNHPLTKALTIRLRARREWLHENWESGLFTDKSVEGTALKNAEVLGELDHIRATIQEITDCILEEEKDVN